jgi:hypothetical protein
MTNLLKDFQDSLLASRVAKAVMAKTDLFKGEAKTLSALSKLDAQLESQFTKIKKAQSILDRGLNLYKNKTFDLPKAAQKFKDAHLVFIKLCRDLYSKVSDVADRNIEREDLPPDKEKVLSYVTEEAVHLLGVLKGQEELNRKFDPTEKLISFEAETLVNSCEMVFGDAQRLVALLTNLLK